MELRFKEILREIEFSLVKSDFKNCEQLVNSIIKSKAIITYGAGRVGLAMQGFSKRLQHLGFKSYFLEDSSVPSTGVEDLLIIGTGSGNTPTVKTVAEVAVKNHLKLITITASPVSPIALMSSTVILLNTPNKEGSRSDLVSIQPMTTLFEQTISIFLDSIVLEMMKATGETSDSMKLRHNVIE
jgi:6-phospho-3-hexuloisomerase